MERDDNAYLLDMLHAAREAVGFAQGLSYAVLTQDRRTQLAIVKSVEVIGEAASRLSLEARNGYPSIPWAEIVAMRNRLVHGYFGIDLKLVWDTVCNDLPALITQLEPLDREDQG